jgi:hypothetical protein
MGHTARNAARFAFKCGGILILFALCGAGSAVISFNHFPEGSFFFPLPFAILCALLFLRRVVVVPLIMLVWYVSYFCAPGSGVVLPIAVGLVRSALPCIVGGLIGGAGLVLCASNCLRWLASAKYIAAGATLGICTAFSFLPSVKELELNLNQGFVHTPVLAFALWEAMMGTYSYAVCTLIVDRKSRDCHDDAGSGAPR